MFILPDTAERFRHDAQAILRLGGPLLVNNLVLAGMSVTNTIAAGRVGPEPLAGVAVGVSYYQIFWLMGVGVLMSLPPLVAHAYGAGRDEEVGHRFRQGLWLSQLLALPLLLALLFVGPVLEWFGTDSRTIPHAKDYVLTLCFGMPAMLAYLAHRYMTEGIGWTRPIMFTAALGLVVNILGNWLFTLGHLGISGLGARGCAIATVMAQWSMLIAIHVYQRRHRFYRRFGLFARFEWPQVRALGDILALGLPIGGSVVSEGALFAVAGLLMSTLGTEIVAAHQIALTWGSIMFMVPLALHSATTVHVGHRIGAGELAAGRFAGWSGIVMCAMFMSASAVVIVAASDQIAALFTSDPDVRLLAVGLLLFVAIFHVPDGIQVGAAGALRGFKDAHVPMMLNFTAYWLVGFPVAYWLGIREAQGPRGIWIGLILGLFTCAVLLTLRYARVSARAVRGQPTAVPIVAMSNSA
jgi:MATE family multidrug resistance protein